jgi:hypothetical protein
VVFKLDWLLSFCSSSGVYGSPRMELRNWRQIVMMEWTYCMRCSNWSKLIWMSWWPGV